MSERIDVDLLDNALPVVGVNGALEAIERIIEIF